MTLIIAEAGVNHNGCEDLALKLVEAAHAAGADIVKFQTFKAARLVTKSAKQANYQLANTKKTETQLAMLSRLELSYETHKKLLVRCNELGIEFLSTAFDEDSLAFLVNDIGIKRLKLPSGEITNAPLALAHAKTGLDIIVSTGMATLSEIESVLGVIAFGYLEHLDGRNIKPSIQAFKEAYASIEGQALLKRKVTLLHCTTEYPAPVKEVNLNVMAALNLAFDLTVGYSDHTAGIEIPIAASALGAAVIEKHFTLDKNMPGPDHKASLDPVELKQMVLSVRNVEQAMGRSVKVPTLSEVKNIAVARKSLVAAAEICEGDCFTVENLDIKRPGDGVSPYLYWEYLGRRATKKFNLGDVVDES
ncbi:N-acetylneuraminate synthase [Marinagarivorans algicola]|uniref:N-acetylneuraminate synthase n=1 Tax=Marinagarivorans algicola TaxID=1513270 RepID=UPI0006B4C0AE|nr:N-acetylneuraminate synthase [Marinagarivorans algicola]